MDRLELRRATFRDLPQVARVLMDAFSRHPLREHMLPGMRRRRLAIASGDTVLFAEGILFGTAYVAVLEGKVVGALSWLDPPQHPRPRLRAVLLDVARAPFLFCPPHGFDGLRFQPALDAFHRNEPSLYFTIAATSPTVQRRGVASALLSLMVKQADEQGVSVFLETSNPPNIALYQKFGFSVVDQATPLANGPTVFAMLRPASPGATVS